ncbi:MAG: hypothetical protein HY898_27830 [Deltaproteobacteria bacterium]|nr:hypothetical protein [Deltaproteobacteria bacterium]
MRINSRYRTQSSERDGDFDIKAALDALGAEELRSFVLEAIGALDDGSRMQLEDALVRRASTANVGWRPAAPAEGIVNEVNNFVAAARRVGTADPRQVDGFLRQAVKASLAGDHRCAAAIFESLLGPIAEAEFDLGQHETVDEVLTVDLNDCVSTYLAAVYLTTPIAQRADHVLDALGSRDGLACIRDPLRAIEGVLGGDIPEIEQFLPLWIALLGREKQPATDWETDQDRWLREAVGRMEGSIGLERIARTTKQPQAVRAWCDVVVAAGDWSKSLAAYAVAADLVPSPIWRGDFLDGAALAAEVLKRKDAAKRLEAAWLGAPSLARMLRWLLAEDPSAATIKKRATAALKAKPTKSARLVGLLHVLAHDIPAAAALLKKAPGLGWSSSDHPGHLLFSVFAWVFGEPSPGSVREGIVRVLNRPVASEPDRGALAFDEGDAAKTTTPQLARYAVLEALQRAQVIEGLATADHDSALAAMKVAAEKRTDGVLGEKRRRHYDHAALLIACCVELECRMSGAGCSAWAEAIRARTAHFPAFQRSLRNAPAQMRKASV